MQTQDQAVTTTRPSIKLSLRFVREKFNVKEHLDSLPELQNNRAGYKNMEKVYIEKVVKELSGKFGHKKGDAFVDVDDSRRGEIIVFKDGSQAKNPLFRETITDRVARQMGHA